MKILQVGGCPLTNQEVHAIVNEELLSLEARSKLLMTNAESRESHFNFERQRTSARNVVDYLKHGNPEFSHLDKGAMNAFLAKIGDMPLTDVEVVQILNLMPSEADILYGICRDNNRLTEHQMKEICALVNHHFLGGSPPPSAAPLEAPAASPSTSEEAAVVMVPMESRSTFDEVPSSHADTSSKCQGGGDNAENSVQQASSTTLEAPLGDATESSGFQVEPGDITGTPVQQSLACDPTASPGFDNGAGSGAPQALSGDPTVSSRLRRGRRPKAAGTATSVSIAPAPSSSQGVVSNAAAPGVPKAVVAGLPAGHEPQQDTEKVRPAARKKKRRIAQEDAATAS